MNIQRVLAAATDCITRFRSSGYPLKNVAQDVTKARNLNSAERRTLFDLIFDFSRETHVANAFIAKNVRFSSSLSVQQKDSLALEIMLTRKSGWSKTKEIADLARDYEQWAPSLGDERFLLAMGPLLHQMLLRDYPEKAVAIARGFIARPAKYVAHDRRYVTLARIEEAMSALGIAHFRHQIMPSALGLHQDIDLNALPADIRPHVWIMDAGSQIIAELVNPKSSDRVLDLCVGEGNKAKFITMKDCDYVAVDIDEQRLARAKQRLDKRVTFMKADGRQLPFQENSFDWILLDAPCSGMGIMRKTPDLALRLTKSALDNYVKLQRELLNSALKLLKPHGNLIYATCSLLKMENEQQISRALAETSQHLPLPLGKLVGENLKLDDEAIGNNSFTLFPHIHDCDGFYFAALTKIDATPSSQLDG